MNRFRGFVDDDDDEDLSLEGECSVKVVVIYFYLFICRNVLGVGNNWLNKFFYLFIRIIGSNDR
jgi:hypothetical protein